MCGEEGGTESDIGESQGGVAHRERAIYLSN